MAETAAGSFPDLKDPDVYLQGVPYDAFARMRREDPVYWNPEADGPGFWCVTRHADIIEVSRNPALFSSAAAHGGHLRLAFTQLAARVKRFELLDQPRRFPSNFINGLKNLNVRLVPA